MVNVKKSGNRKLYMGVAIWPSKPSAGRFWPCDMEWAWKQQILRQLSTRDKLQLGNYGKLVESYTKLLDQQDEDRKEHKLYLNKEQQEEKLISSQSSNREGHGRNTSECSCCKEAPRLREEIETLVNRLGCIEREHEKLLSRLMEDKLKKAQRVNQVNEKIDRYQKRNEKTYQADPY